ncbi:MAG: YceI family protein [Bacteroidota bacterium]
MIGGSFEADMKSITVTDISDSTENRHFVEHIADSDFFEVNTYPTASFTITKVAPLNGQEYEVTGTMRIKEKDNPMTFKITVAPADNGQRVSAVVTVDRTLFGIEYGSKGKPGSEPDWFILDEFVLNINVVASGD